MREWKIKLDKFGISASRYKELSAFCEQYPEWKQFLAEHDGSVGAMVYSDMPKAHNTDSSVEKIAIKRAIFSEKTDIIEKAAEQCDSYYAKYIIKAVCYKVPVTYLISCDGMNSSKETFYRVRRKFFYLLNKLKS